MYNGGGGGGGGDYDFSIYLKHGWLMWAAWGILGLIQLASNRYLKMFWRVNRAIHIFSGTSIFIITMTMGLLAMKRGDWKIEKMWHSIMGFIILCMVGLLCIGGLIVVL